jgi:hypothetical protein
MIPGFCVVAVSPVQGAITFLNHFNSTSTFDVVPANGDIAAGSPGATVVGSPTHGVGFFPGSSPTNGAYVGTVGQTITFNGHDGNINFTSPTTGGITAGAWVKHSSMGVYGRIFMLGAQAFDDDALLFDYGNAHGGVPRAYFRDGGGFSSPLETPSAVDTSNWVYTAVSVDLSGGTMTLHTYDSSGVALPGTPVSTSIPVSGWNLNNPLAVDSLIRIGAGLDTGMTLTMDEFSIDDEALSAAAISSRVASMVAGNQLAVPEPAAGLSLMVAGLVLARRKRRA